MERGARASRGRELDLDDALAMKFTPPPTGAERHEAAFRFFNKNDFVMGRLVALQAIAAFKEEGDPGGFKRGLDLLISAGALDLRSHIHPADLC